MPSDYAFSDKVNSVWTVLSVGILALKQWVFPYFKRGFDIIGSLILLVPLCVVGLILLILNPLFNPGELFYRQVRMGRKCEPFSAIKFRSMRPLDPKENSNRGANDPLEQDRIPPLGRILRKTRLDELPQVINVLRGDMSLIGPRPDAFHHAEYYLLHIEGYRERHSVRPGISGLAQVTVGYAEGVDATQKKVAADLIYINRKSFRQELKIVWLTIVTVARFGGS